MVEFPFQLMYALLLKVAIAPNGVSFRSCWKDFDLSKNDTQVDMFPYFIVFCQLCIFINLFVCFVCV